MKKQTVTLFKKCKAIMGKQQVELKKYHVPIRQRIENIRDIETSYNLFCRNLQYSDFVSCEICLQEILETAIEIVISHGIEQNFEDFLPKEIGNIEVLFQPEMQQKYIHNNLETAELISFWSEIIGWTLAKIEEAKIEGTVLTEIEEKYTID